MTLDSRCRSVQRWWENWFTAGNSATPFPTAGRITIPRVRFQRSTATGSGSVGKLQCLTGLYPMTSVHKKPNHKPEIGSMLGQRRQALAQHWNNLRHSGQGGTNDTDLTGPFDLWNTRRRTGFVRRCADHTAPVSLAAPAFSRCSFFIPHLHGDKKPRLGRHYACSVKRVIRLSGPHYRDPCCRTLSN